MPISDYQKLYWLQGRQPIPTEFGGVLWTIFDSMKVYGVVSQARQAEIRVAVAQGIRAQYNFMTENMALGLNPNDILRRDEDNAFFRISGIGERSPDVAESQFQLYPMELISREAAERGAAG